MNFFGKFAVFMVLISLSSPLLAQDATVSPEMFAINNTWMMVAAFLVFIMHLGFAALEAGVSHAKNTVNILYKNLAILCIGMLTYAITGFNLMYPGEEFAGGFFGFAGFGIDAGISGQSSAYNSGYTYYTDFLFQAMFAATAVTIVSGAVAERIKLSSFLAFATIYVTLAYPLVGMWKWGGGWLASLGFHDFAGSTLVHAVGGWAALMGAWMLGPRKGRFCTGKPVSMGNHNLPLAMIGVFLLWLGWFGFNGGSVLSADPASVSLVLVTTNLAAAAGVAGALFASFFTGKHYDLSMGLNGALAGLVSITAGADVMTPMSAAMVGLIGGVIVVLGISMMEKLKIDDPVSAVPVHLACGVWGTLAVGIFGAADAAVLGYALSFKAQLIGVAAVGGFCLVTSFLTFKGIQLMTGLRVSEEVEMAGLDLHEHGVHAYSGMGVTLPN